MPSPCCYIGRCAHWIEFEDRYVVAYARGQLTPLASRVLADLIREGRPATEEAVELELTNRIDNARPWSMYLPLGLSLEAAEPLIRAIAVDVIVREAA